MREAIEESNIEKSDFGCVTDLNMDTNKQESQTTQTDDLIQKHEFECQVDLVDL